MIIPYSIMKQWIEIWHAQKKKENGAGKKTVGHSKLKLWTFLWGQGECEWPLYHIVIF